MIIMAADVGLHAGKRETVIDLRGACHIDAYTMITPA